MQTAVMISSPHRVLRCDAVACALLRDNVQHYLENGAPSGRFAAIHSLADAHWVAGAKHLNPGELALELEVAWPCLRDIPIELLAISIRTRAALSNARRPPDIRGTILHRFVQWPLPLKLDGIKTLVDLFGPLVTDLGSLACETHPNAELVMQAVPEAAVPSVPTKWLH